MFAGIDMKFTPQIIPDLILIEPNIYYDDRGYFSEIYREDLLLKSIGSSVKFVQDNESMSTKGVLRGLHYQLPPFAQSKLLRVLEGKILDITVDIRKSSPTFGNHVAIEISSENMRQLFIPSGFAHGFLVLSDKAKINYKIDNFYMPEYDRGIAFNDPRLKINLPISFEKLQLSKKDKLHPNLHDALDLFE
jgi:dTDP-4-dehydrorhamnose 3,5-epimerase